MLNNIKLEKTVVISAFVAAASLALAGCSSGGGEKQSAAPSDASTGGDKVTVRVSDWFTDDHDFEVYQSVLDTCAAENDVILERETIPGSDYMQKVLQMSSSKTLPDLLMIDAPDMPQLATTGALLPLEEFGLSAEGKVQGIIDGGTFDGVLYGLQPNTNSLALIYNQDMLDAAGVEVPKTWSDLKEAAKELSGDGVYGFGFAAPASYTGTFQFLPFMWSNGGSEEDLTGAKTAEALQLWVDLVKDGSASESVVNWDQSDVNEQFMAGNLAMQINGPWQIPVLEATDINWGLATIPVPTAGDPVIGPLGGEVWTLPVSGDEKKQEAAAKMLACLDSSENQLRVGDERGTVPTSLDLWDDYLESNPLMAPVVEMVETAQARTGKLGLEWPIAAEQIYTGIQSALVGGLTPEEALEQATR